jgi:hypothetical protein
MIDLEQIREYFRTTINNSAIIPLDAIQYENAVFDPSGKALWMRESYLNVDEGFSDSVNGDQIQGILSYSINIPIGTYESVATSAGVAIGNLFPTATIIETTDYKISIDATKRPQQGVLYAGSKWYTVTIDVEFRAYE